MWRHLLHLPLTYGAPRRWRWAGGLWHLSKREASWLFERQSLSAVELLDKGCANPAPLWDTKMGGVTNSNPFSSRPPSSRTPKLTLCLVCFPHSLSLPPFLSLSLHDVHSPPNVLQPYHLLLPPPPGHRQLEFQRWAPIIVSEAGGCAGKGSTGPGRLLSVTQYCPASL